MAPPPPASSSSLTAVHTFDDLEGDFFKDDVLIRLIHFWESRNFKLGNILRGFELLLIDTKSTTIQGFIPVSRLSRFEGDLKPNAIYKLRRFLITEAKTLYRVSDHKYGLTFTNQTVLDEVKETDHEIETQLFRLRTQETFASIVDTGTELYDVIGKIDVATGNNLDGGTPMCTIPYSAPAPSKDKIFVHLRMEDGKEPMRIFLWDKIAEAFRNRWNAKPEKPTVLLLTTVNPKFFGAVTLGSTPATRLFFDNDLPQTRELLTRLGDEGKIPATVGSSSSAIAKLEIVTLNEIHEFLQNEIPQKASFICIATVIDVLKEHGWNYVSCTGCKSKVTKKGTSLLCNRCSKTITVGLLRYRYEISVRDDNGLATFVIFDDEAAKIAGRSASDTFNDMEEGGENTGIDSRHSTMPESLLDIVGRTCKFQVSVSNFTFSAIRPTITVSRILDYNYEKDSETGQAEPDNDNNTEVGEENGDKGEGNCSTLGEDDISKQPHDRNRKNKAELDPKNSLDKKEGKRPRYSEEK